MLTQENDGWDEEWENIPCIKCGRTDLPLHENYQCPDCWPNGN